MSNRPDNIPVYNELDLKLGIKSSLPHVKSTLALAILLWEAAGRPAELIYSKQDGNNIIVTDDLAQKLIEYCSEICTSENLTDDTIVSTINENQLFKSQMEALIVAFELVWKIAKVDFVEANKPASSERTGGIRYPKKLNYTVYADIIHNLVDSDKNAYCRILMAWVGFQVNIDGEKEKLLISTFTVLAEGALFKLTDGEKDVVFNQDSIYRKTFESDLPVDINGDKEAKGSLRILKSLLSDGMNPFLTYDNGSVTVPEQKVSELESYQKRVDTYLRLSATKVVLNKEDVVDFVTLSPEWFQEKAKEFTEEDAEAAALYIDFEGRFGADALSVLAGEDLLKSLFLGGNNDNLCHELEYVKRNTELFGSVKGGNAYKYPLFFDKESSMWMTGTRANPKQLTLDEAIIKGTAVRDGLLKGIEIIREANPLETVEEYLALYTKLYAAIPELVDSLWVTKYFHMLFPEVFPVFYNKDWQLRVLSALNIIPNDTAYGRLGQINAFVKECAISNVAFARVFHKYCRNLSVEEQDDIGIEEVVAERKTGGTNIILYGVPGAGKSWTIKHEYCNDESLMERLVFHPDYTYSDFVGQILPKIAEDGSVSYEFSAGPFTKLVKKAYLNPDKLYYLVIEEVNRGNAPAIFGDIFQLLDRNKDGSSEYEITNADIAKIVYGNENHKVSIPSNMSILCTMNTSDQNVFTLDTAFQRRWNMRLIKNKFHDEEDEKKFAGTKILDTKVTWEHFFTEINKIILSKNIRMTSSEDKRLGTHFVAEEDLKYVAGNERQNSKFPEKVLKYLWDDAFKFTKEDIFDLDKVKSLEDVIENFVSAVGNDRFKVFKENIFNTIVPKDSASSITTASDVIESEKTESSENE